MYFGLQLPALARDLQVSVAMAGQLVTLFAFTVMLCGPLLTAWLSHVERKRLFVVILLVFAAANALAAMATSIWVLAIARFIPALVLPVFWGTASETAAQIVGPQKAGLAVSRVYLGISAALLFGIPLGTVAAIQFGWRSTFGLLSGLSLIMAIALAAFMPRVAQPTRVRMAEQLRILHDKRFLLQILLSVLVFTAMFTAYTYLADFLETVAGVKATHVGWWLMGFGAVGLGGNWLGGRYVDRNPLGATIVCVVVLGLGMLSSVSMVSSYTGLAGALAIWGIAYTALFPICQVRVMKAASHAQALAGTFNVSAANAGTGLGAMLGGLVIPTFGVQHITYVAAGVALVAVLLAISMIKR
ncbi:MFS transporter [Paenalcaligenes sp. Me131]|uniref:MFS transporter n=1 Tax=Paenalcaligenes sp. Me131 TaxID=3392636 RepID=UPI003D273A55